MEASEVFDIVKDVVLSCAAIATAIVAILGLKSWSRELRGRASFETAKSLVRATYRLRDELQSCRSPFVTSSEFPDDYDVSGPKSAQQQANAWAHVYNTRWHPVRDAALAFGPTVLEAEALWGHEIREKADELRQCARNLQVAMEATIDDKAHSGTDFASDKDFARHMRSVTHASRDDRDNLLTKKIEDAVAAIEAIAKPHLKRS
jgi:gas vesicle protein